MRPRSLASALPLAFSAYVATAQPAPRPFPPEIKPFLERVQPQPRVVCGMTILTPPPDAQDRYKMPKHVPPDRPSARYSGRVIRPRICSLRDGLLLEEQQADRDKRQNPQRR